MYFKAEKYSMEEMIKLTFYICASAIPIINLIVISKQQNLILCLIFS